ncbi:hypothetical protein PY365_21065 [Roseiarcaceae bacterium H3SJ34-1]|uniref:hypothetical protein n=1 Tax=Terripilifer ovatus TaxID=3032367 RepID=UPI003AB9B173|nr:hypothetical protein [Roseiarcaceae bacterium H3SJ34-1]
MDQESLPVQSLPRGSEMIVKRNTADNFSPRALCFPSVIKYFYQTSNAYVVYSICISCLAQSSPMTLAVSKFPTDPDFKHEKPASRNAPADKMLNLLVDGDKDIVGLFAYSLHQQNFHDWCMAFEVTHGYKPSNADIRHFELGEHTQRRRAAYRREAEWRLARQSQDLSGSANATQSIIQRAYLSASRKVAQSAGGRRWRKMVRLLAGTAMLRGARGPDGNNARPNPAGANEG